jgi:hypothetical protein
MNPDDPPSHLSRISTPWSLMRRAHKDSGACASSAQRLLVQRYCGAVFRYLRGALKDEEAALELLQEFVLRFSVVISAAPAQSPGVSAIT